MSVGMRTPIYVIGSSNTDMVVKTERLPRPGETILGGTFQTVPGGKGANQAVAAARLGGNVSFVACLGNDLFGQQALARFKNEGIDTRFVSFDSVAPSGVALINVDDTGENCIAVAPGSNSNLDPLLLKSFVDALTNPALVLVQLEIPIATVEFIIKQCANKSVPLILNPAPAALVNNSLWPYLFAITPNESETEVLTGIKITNDASVTNAAKAFHDKGIRNVVITLGKRGAYWSNEIGAGFVGAAVVNAVDSTAAGDCFSGALAVALAEGKALPEAVSFACKAATLSVTRMGAQTSMPYRKEVD